jgi:NAD(P)-dependent dehydrogenase (short-subunit alcohol dehydrogenase family)
MAGGRGEVGGRLAVVGAGGRVGTGGKQQLGQLGIAVLGRGVERPVSVGLDRVDIGSRRDEETRDADVATGRGAVERHDLERVSGDDVRWRRVGDEKTRCVDLAEKRGQMEGCEPVAREGRRTGAVTTEQLGQPIRPPESGGVEEVELRTGREELRDGIVVVPIAGMEDRGNAVDIVLAGKARLGCEQLPKTPLVAGVDRIEHCVSGHRAPRRASGQVGATGNRQPPTQDSRQGLPEPPAGRYSGPRRRSRPGGTAGSIDRSNDQEDSMRLSDKVAIITGAGGGMGRVASQMFAAEGAKIVVAEFGEAAGEETVRLVREAGGDASFVKTDVSSEASAKAMVDHAVSTYGRVDVLYNNAGIMPEADHSVIDTDVATWDQVMAVNVRGVFLGCKFAIPQMVTQGSGSIINIASFVALLGCSVPQDAYTASKGALLSLTRSLAVQFGPNGIRTNAICPGPVETPLLMDWLVKDEEAKRIRLARNPTGRFGKPEEIVNMALYLASDESRWTNGASLVVDGGISVNYF